MSVRPEVQYMGSRVLIADYIYVTLYYGGIFPKDGVFSNAQKVTKTSFGLAGP